MSASSEVRIGERIRFYRHAKGKLVHGLLRRARPTYAPQVRALAERIGLLA